MIKRLKFTNGDIHNCKSDFSQGPKSKGKSKDRAHTPFYMNKHTQFKGLNFCKYKKGEKKRFFLLGRFDNNLSIVTKGTNFGVVRHQIYFRSTFKLGIPNDLPL